MKIIKITLLLLLGSGPVLGQLRRPVGETAEAFARRNPPAPAATLTGKVLETNLWDGKTQLVFAFYWLERTERNGAKSHQEPYVEGYVFVPTAAGGYRRVLIDRYGQEGADAEIARVFFANADADAAKELVVMCAWPQQHYDISGTLYQVYFYDAPAAAVTRLARLPALEKQFPLEFDGTGEDGKPAQARYKTAAAIRQKLKALRY